jgi:hypothetical protein
MKNNLNKISAAGQVVGKPEIKNGFLQIKLFCSGILVVLRIKAENVSRWFDINDSVFFSGEILEFKKFNGGIALLVEGTVDVFPLCDQYVLIQTVTQFGKIENGEFESEPFVFRLNNEQSYEAENKPVLVMGLVDCSSGKKSILPINVLAIKKLSPNTSLREIKK